VEDKMEGQGGGEQVGELVRLSQIEYEQDPAAPNLIGWAVADQQGEEFGKLDDMLVDVDTGEVPFASVCYGGKCTAVPLEVMFMDEPNQRLVVPVDKDEMMNAPEFTEDTEDVQPFIDYWNEITADWDMEYDEGD
jgi:sporulation protein YlmC with PRC-barrel domain